MTHGGARTGAGRKPQEYVRISALITPETNETLNDICEKTKLAKGKIVDLAIEEYKKKLG